MRVIAKCEGVNRPLVGHAAHGSDRLGLREDRDAFPTQQTPDEASVGLVDLPRELAYRIAIGLQCGHVEIECARECIAAHLPLVHQRHQNFGHAARSEHAGVRAAVHQRQGVAHAQLIDGQLAVGLTGLHFAHDCIDCSRAAAIGRQPDRHGQAEKQRRRQMVVRGHAGQYPVDSRHQPFADIGVMECQQVTDRALRLAEMEIDWPHVPVNHARHKFPECLCY
ncbi:hypothetical protein PI86_07695 [Burkholderia sp. A9]|nr:hypothetical protein PI86_07695 [Burkholderia sp. A9]